MLQTSQIDFIDESKLIEISVDLSQRSYATHQINEIVSHKEIDPLATEISDMIIKLLQLIEELSEIAVEKD